MSGCGTGGADLGDLGDLVIVLLASTLAGLRDRLRQDRFEEAADLVAELVDIADGYLGALPARCCSEQTAD